MKKVISLLLCAILAFSIFTCVVSAESPADPEKETIDEEYSYVTPTIVTTTDDIDIESIVDEFLGDNLRDKHDDALVLIKFFRGLFEKVVAFFQAFVDYLAGLGQ